MCNNHITQVFMLSSPKHYTFNNALRYFILLAIPVMYQHDTLCFKLYIIQCFHER